MFGTALVEGLRELIQIRPKFPGLTPRESVLKFLSIFLKCEFDVPRGSFDMSPLSRSATHPCGGAATPTLRAATHALGCGGAATHTLRCGGAATRTLRCSGAAIRTLRCGGAATHNSRCVGAATHILHCCGGATQFPSRQSGNTRSKFAALH